MDGRVEGRLVESRARIMTSGRRRAEIILTLVIHANAAGVEADVVLVFVSLVLHDVEERRVFHLQPEFAVFVFQRRLILFLEDTTTQSALCFLALGEVNVGEKKKVVRLP